ncbi:uncharacterized protein LOC119435325 [Dermacentor silvarum]|uniref:uncharacterized protein LOC119435325 n=1 Tax=Dermacentor silvarum TaxID=543639 RepID=UPI001898D9AA|nr:uncharacterized protein LOC119435325 [Dermacentor silvarum]
MNGGGQYGIVGPVVNVPVEVDTMVKSLPRNIHEDHAINVHIKRRILNKTSYLSGVVKKSHLKPWLDVLCRSTLYRYFAITLDASSLDALPDDDAFQLLEDSVETIPQCPDVHNPVDACVALNAFEQSVVWDEERYLAIAPGEHRQPLSILYDERAEELSFPQIYLGEPRRVKAEAHPTPFTYATSEIRRKDRRGVSPHHILFMAMKVLRFRVSRGLAVTFRVNDDTDKITRQMLEDEHFIQDTIDQDMAFMKGVPNTVHYWQQRKKDVFAMIRQLGKPTAFLTLSASEMHWPRLLALLERLRQQDPTLEVHVSEMTSIYRAQLVNSDPVVCAIYFNKLVSVILNVLCSRTHSPFKPYRVVDYFKRIEFQHRGSPHAHILLWLDNAPCETVSSDMPETIRLATHLVSLDTSVLPRLRTQVHQHTHTCYKRGNSRCRFGAPFWPTDNTMVLLPYPPTQDDAEATRRVALKERFLQMHAALESTHYDSIGQFLEHHAVTTEEKYVSVLRAGVTRPTLFIQRTVQQKWINVFNPWVASMLDSNMDLQIILDAYSCAAYVVEYVNKSNRGVSNLHKAVSDILADTPNIPYGQALRLLGVKMLKAVEMSAQEAAWTLLRQEMSESSRRITYIATCLPEERTRVRKTRAQMEAAGLDAASTDVWKFGVLRRYEDRPDILQDVCLADFVAHYNLHTYQKRRDPAVIRYRCYSIDESLNYMREAVTLFLPFRREVDILDGNAFEHMYAENMDALLLKRSEYDSKFDIHQLRHICLQMCTDDARSSELHTATDPHHVPLVDQNDDEDLLGPPDANSVAPKGRCAAVCTRQDVMTGDAYREMMRLANKEQLEVVREVIHRLTTPTSDPLRIFLTGVAGCGKTFVLRLIMDAYNRYTNTASTCTHNAYVACATTGKAAVAIGGLTVHAAFKLSMRADGGLRDGDLNSFRTAFTNVKCVIVDECSMMSSNTLARVDDRLRQITGNYNDPFGGLDFIMCGDLRQLPPVRSSEVYKRSKTRNNIFNTHVTWHHLSYFPLVQVVRQSDAIFSAALSKIGDGHALEKEEIDMFQARFVSKQDANSRCPHAVRLFYSNKDAEAYNTHDAVQDVHDIHEANADDSIIGYRTDAECESAKRRLHSLTTAEVGNLPRKLVLCLGKPYMLTLNIDVSDGLVNGAAGHLNHVQFDEMGHAKRVWLHFHCRATGNIARLKANPIRQVAGSVVPVDSVPIELRTATVTLDRRTGVSCRRKQFPVMQASAVTIHKSQGGTYSEVVYDYHKRHPQKLVYVALSRATTLHGLYLTNAEDDFTFYHCRENPDRALSDEFRRLQNHKLNTIAAECFAVLHSPHRLAICNINVRSLPAHAFDVSHDHVVREVPVLCLSETWTDSAVELPGYKCVTLAKRHERRAAGVAVYEHFGGTTLSPRNVPYQLNTLPQMSCGDACAIQTSQGFIVAACYLSPGTSRSDVTDFFLRNFRAVCLENAPVIITGDFNVNVLRRENEWLLAFLDAELGLRLLSDVTQPTTRNNTCLDLVFGKGIPSRVHCVTFPTYFSDHKPVLVVVE